MINTKFMSTMSTLIEKLKQFEKPIETPSKIVNIWENQSSQSCDKEEIDLLNNLLNFGISLPKEFLMILLQVLIALSNIYVFLPGGLFGNRPEIQS